MKFKTAIFGLLAAVLCFSLSGCKWGKDDDKKPAPAGTGYELSVYQDGKLSQKVEADQYTTDGDQVSYHLKSVDRSGKDTGTVNGTWVVKHNSWKPVASDKRYTATLYSGKTAVGSWGVHTFTTDSRSTLLFPADGSEVLRVCGNLVVQESKSGAAGRAVARVTVYSGDQKVYTVELSSYQVIGQHLEGTPADGSGYTLIWGNYKVEELN